MPIKPENRNKYPADWDDISYRIRIVRAKNRCEVCGVVNHSIIHRMKDGSFRYASQAELDHVYARKIYSHSSLSESIKYHGFVRVVLTVAHLDHNPENCADDNLKAMCQKCHNSYDRSHRDRTIRESKNVGQMSFYFV